MRNNKCAVVGKALQTWDSSQSLLDWWHEQDGPDEGKLTPLSTDNTGAYLLVMTQTEGYRLTVDDDTNRLQFRISPKPYKKVTGHLRGEPDTADTLVGVDINERNVALTALDCEKMWTNGTLVLDYRRVKQKTLTATQHLFNTAQDSLPGSVGQCEVRFRPEEEAIISVDDPP